MIHYNILTFYSANTTKLFAELIERAGHDFQINKQTNFSTDVPGLDWPSLASLNKLWDAFFLTTSVEILLRSSEIHYWRKTTGSQTIVTKKNNTNIHKYNNTNIGGWLMVVVGWWGNDLSRIIVNDSQWTMLCCARCDNEIMCQFITKTTNVLLFLCFCSSFVWWLFPQL